MQALNAGSNALDDAFRALVEVVNTFEKSGRTLRSAAIKVALQLKLSSFDQRDLGFESFRAFLKAAEARGLVQLAEADKGPDIDVLPAQGQSLGGAFGRIDRIRPDVWKAFTRWGDDRLRFWNPEEKRAYWIKKTDWPGERSIEKAARAAYSLEPTKYVPIQCIPAETVKGWMTDFSEARRPGLPGDALVAALASSQPFHEFTQLVRRLGLGSQWHQTYAGSVRQVIEQWASENKLEVDLSPSADPAPIEPIEPGATKLTDLTLSESSIRATAHLLIDRMTLSELLELRLTLRLLLNP